MFILKFLVATLLAQVVSGFSSGAAGCEGSGAAVGGAHVDTTNPKKVVTQVPLTNRSTVLKINGITIAPNGTATIPSGKSITIAVTATSFKGVLMRLSGPLGYDLAGTILPNVNTQTARACVAPFAGVTHTSSADKTTASGTLFFSKPSPVGANLVLDLTMVFSNSDTLSLYTYGQFSIKVTQGPPVNAPVAPPVSKPKCGFGTVNVSGSTTVLPVSQGWASEYNKKCKSPSFTVFGGGSGQGAKDGCNGIVEVVNLSRDWNTKTEAIPLNDTLSSSYQCIIGGGTRTFAKVDVAIDGITVIIERLNGTAKDCIDVLPNQGLSSFQLRWMYSNLATLENITTANFDLTNSDFNPATKLWSELKNDPKCKAQNIVAVGPDFGFGTNDFFASVLFTSKTPPESFRADYVKFPDNSNQLRDYVLNTDGAIGYLGFSYYNRNQIPLRAIAINTVTPNATTLSADAYQPLGRRIYSSFLKTTESMAKTKCWVEFGFTAFGALIVSDTGFLPIPTNEWTIQVSKVNGSCTIAPTPPPTPAPIAPTTAPVAPSPSPCFSKMNTVETQDRGVVAMSQIKVGDFVKASNGEFTQVYGFGHVDQDYETEYLQFYFAMMSNETDVMSYHAQPLEITGRHLVFVEKNGRQYPVRASKVTVGDKLSDKIVASIAKVTRRGLYAPLTQSGDLVVSGVVASSYVDLLDYDVVYDHHTMGHALFSVQRMFCSYFMDTCKKESYVNGYGPVARVLVTASDVINNLGWFANMIVGLLSAPVVALFYNFDTTVLVVACVGASAWFTTGRRSM